ncbi:MAG: hypothetical protein ACREIU_00800 [Planctomycetota bacterium]
MLRIWLLASAASLFAGQQAPSGPQTWRIRERVRFARLMREDIDWPRGKGVGSEGFVRLPAKLRAELDAALGGLGASCVWVGGQILESRTRVVGIAASEWGPKDGIENRLESIGFRVDWLLATGVVGTKEPKGPGGNSAPFTQVGGALDGVAGPDNRYILVVHLPECKPERLLALMKDAGPKIPWDSIRLEVVSGDPGVGGTKLQRALAGLPGVRLVPPGANAERFAVEVEMRQLSELETRGTSVFPCFGAPSIQIVERLKKEGIEVRAVD